MTPCETITSREKTLAFLIKREVAPAKTTFITPNEQNFQAGFIVYPKGGEVRRHDHKRFERNLTGTSEVLVVRKGLAEVDIYDDERRFVATRELREGDVLVIVAGGHSFRMLEDTIFFEVKQGPYTGMDEKDFF